MYLGGGDLNGIFFFSPIDPATIGNCAFGQKSPGELGNPPCEEKGRCPVFLLPSESSGAIQLCGTIRWESGYCVSPSSLPPQGGGGERERRGRRKRRRRRLAPPPPPPVMLPAGILLPPPSVASSSFGEPLGKIPFQSRDIQTRGNSCRCASRDPPSGV